MNKKRKKDNIDDQLEVEITQLDLMEMIGAKIDQREIYLFGPVDTNGILSVIESIHFLEKKDQDRDIELYINSDGGYVDDCFALIDVMDASPCDIKVIVLGRAASAACLIASNGTYGKRYSGRNAEFMYHEPTGDLPPVRLSEMKYWKEEMTRIENKCNRIFSRNTGQSLKIINDMFSNRHLDRWMVPLEAKKFGIIDKILPIKKRVNKKIIEIEE
jgi:ATP-dependent Clp protease protease subunit